MARQPEPPPPDDRAEDEWDPVEFAEPPAEPPASAPATSALNISPPEFLDLREMSEEDLKSLAKAVLSEFERRSPGPRDLSFPYRDLVSGLHRRLGDARAEAKSGFGIQRSNALPIARRLLVRHGRGEELSDEMKAQVLDTLAAELMVEDGSTDPEPSAADVAAQEASTGDATRATDTMATELEGPSPSTQGIGDIEEEIRQAIESEVNRLKRR